MASAMISPMEGSLLAEMAPTWAIISPLTSRLDFFSSSAISCHGLIDSLFDQIGIGAGRDIFQAFSIDDLGQNRGGRGSVSGHIRSLGSDFLDQLSAHVFKRIFEFDFLGHGHTVFGAGGGTEFLIQDHIFSAGSQGFFDDITQDIDTL